MTLSNTRLVFLDVETTGLSPAMGDRVVEIGIIVCEGARELERFCHLVNPEREIPDDARAIHGIRDQDVAEQPPFSVIAKDVCSALHDAWVVGHNVRFDVGFVAMELSTAGLIASPSGSLDTCQLARSVWNLPNYALGTVVRHLGIAAAGEHRALADAELCRSAFSHAITKLGGWKELAMADLSELHVSLPTWPEDPRPGLPIRLRRALENSKEVSIGYINGNGEQSTRKIRPVACFAAGQHAYVRADCSKAGEMRTFRVDRIVVD